MARVVQDQFIEDEEEETCPLCVEEFDLSDKAFRPCPCGYQVCQFCYHNVRTNMNGLCPACRRPYDDSTIEFRKPSAEEEAAWKARQAAKQKKSAAAQAKEAQKREADTLSRKHLSGLRVVQKNLVYVTGLNPSIGEDRLLETLRGQQYFGQYGKIVKIVVSKAKDHLYPQSVGVYVTFARKEDAQSCIDAVDGTDNGDRVLRAQYGTTKYCSAYLRHEQCQNKNCMFLHEPGEDKDSFTRQDLSSWNVNSSQPGANHGAQPPPQSQQPVAAAHPSHRQDAAQSSSETGEGPALPSTASWASKQFTGRTRTPSHSIKGSSQSPMPSPAVSSSKPVPTTSSPSKSDIDNGELTAAAAHSEPSAPFATPFDQVLKTFASSNIGFVFSSASLSPSELEAIRNYPALFDINGGAKRHAIRLKEEQERQERQEHQRQQTEERLALQTVSTVEGDEHLERGGSHQLGGEPDDHQGLRSQSRTTSGQFGLGSNLGEDEMASLGQAGRGLTSQQQQQLLLQQFKNPSSLQGQGQTGMSQSNTPAGHARNYSRFSFANDSASASAAVKPVANPKLMSQQNSMMPSQQAGGFGQQSQQQSQSFYSSTVSGPPPGLKTTGTPPVTGRGMFGQGHGFASNTLGYGANFAGRNANGGDMLFRHDTGQSDATKLNVADSSFHQARLQQHGGASSGPGQFDGQNQGAFQSVMYRGGGQGPRW